MVHPVDSTLDLITPTPITLWIVSLSQAQKHTHALTVWAFSKFLCLWCVNPHLLPFISICPLDFSRVEWGNPWPARSWDEVQPSYGTNRDCDPPQKIVFETLTYDGTVVSAATLQQKGWGYDSRPGVFLPLTLWKHACEVNLSFIRKYEWLFVSLWPNNER